MANRTTKINWEYTIEKFSSYEGTVTDFAKILTLIEVNSMLPEKNLASYLYQFCKF